MGGNIEVGGVNADVNGVGVGNRSVNVDGTERERECKRGWRPVEEHRMGTGTGAGMVTRAVAVKETATRM